MDGRRGGVRGIADAPAVGGVGSGEPDEIGPLAVYLASPASAYVTGAAFVIDGGYTAW